ncbi:MAG: hypothetical protein ACK4MM_03045 [Fervidobacterium sp.]
MSNPNVKEVKVFYFESSRESYEYLQKAYETHKTFLHGTLKGYFFPLESLKINYIQEFDDIGSIFGLFPKTIIETLKQELLKSDLTILEIHDDFDIFLSLLLYYLGVKYILSISSRVMIFRYYIEMLLPNVLKGAHFIVVPDEGVASIIFSKFQVSKKKIVIANVDWPSKFTYEKYMRDIRTKKLSEKLKKPQLCIVSPIVCYKLCDSPLSISNYYVSLIEKFLNLGFMVHLYTKNIIKSFFRTSK